ncbi:MAG: LCP family protein [Patescibacteria group bacterium]
MNFLRKKQFSNELSKKPFYKKRGWKIVFLIISVLFVVGLSFASYLFSKGSKIFEGGFSGSEIIKTLYGQELLKGEKEDRINVLLMGIGGQNHPGGYLADSIIMISIQPSTKKAAMVSIPRDLYVSIEGHGEAKINESFADGYNDYINKNCKKSQKQCQSSAISAGAELSSKTVGTTLNQPIQYYVVGDFSGFEKIIDQLGGVDVYVDKALYDPFFPADDMVNYAPFRINAGQQHLDGKTALKFARSRETTSDFDRAARQQKVMAGIKNKAMNAGILANPKKISDLVSTLGDSVHTNFSPSELRSFLNIIKDLNDGDMINKVLKTGADGELIDSNNGTYYLKPKSGSYREIQNTIKNIFTIGNSDEKFEVEVINGSGTSGLASKASKKIEDISNLEIVSISSSTSKVAKSVINDYSDGKSSQTIELIKKNLGINLVVKKTVGASNNSNANKQVDISIIIGGDYKIAN